MIKGVTVRGKTILFLGLVISALFIYLCIVTKKDALYAQLIEKQKPQPIATSVKQVQKEPLKPIMIKKALKEGSFAYMGGEKKKIAAFLSESDKDSNITHFIENICPEDNCIKEIKYFKDIAPFSLSSQTISLIEYAQSSKIQNFLLYMNNKTLKLEGEANNTKVIEAMNPLLNPYLNYNYTIENNIRITQPVKKSTTIAKPKKEVVKKISQVVKKREKRKEIEKIEVIEEPRDSLVIPQHLTVEEAEMEIGDILAAQPITFDYKSSDITDTSKESLGDIADIILGMDNITVKVAGYTDAKGDAIYNKVLSQKRADAVRKYLIKYGVRAAIITSKGYGEENPISTENDIINRRVEIHLIEGENR